MAIVTTSSGTIVIGEQDISFVRLLTLRGALKLEMVGLKWRGRSVSAILKSEFGFKGNKQKLLDQLNTLIAQEEKKRANTTGTAGGPSVGRE